MSADLMDGCRNATVKLVKWSTSKSVCSSGSLVSLCFITMGFIKSDCFNHICILLNLTVLIMSVFYSRWLSGCSWFVFKGFFQQNFSFP